MKGETIPGQGGPREGPPPTLCFQGQKPGGAAPKQGSRDRPEHGLQLRAPPSPEQEGHRFPRKQPLVAT